MNNKIKINYKLLIILIITTLILPLAFADWFGSFKNMITGKVATGNLSASVSINQNYAPNITFVSDPGVIAPVAGSNQSVVFWFIANDSNTVTDINNATAAVNVTYPGELPRTAVCSGVNDPTETSRNFSCVVQMQYYDKGDPNWNINASVADFSGVIAVNNTRNFTYQGVLNINLTNSTVSWSNQGVGLVNRSANAPINVTNIGNLIIRNVTIEGYELLLNGSITTYRIGAGNFSVTNLTGASCTVPALKTALINDTPVNMSVNANVTTYVYSKGPYSTPIYYCLDVPAGLINGIYNTTNPWITTGQQ